MRLASSYNEGAYNDGEFLGSKDGRDPYDAGPVKVNCGGELESEVEDQPNPPKLDEGGDILARIAQGNSSATNSIPTSHGEKTGMENHFERQTQMVNKKCSFPHWTEEQLDELLAFD